MAQLTTTTAGRAEGEAGPDRRFPPPKGQAAFAFHAGAAGNEGEGM